MVSTMIYERIDVTKATGKIPVNQRKIHQLVHRVQAQWGVLYVKWFQEKKIVLLVVVSHWFQEGSLAKEQLTSVHGA